MSNTSLAGCPTCSRHVRVHEPACPFCGASLDGLKAPRPRRALTRFAMIAGAALSVAACGPSATDEPVEEQTVGGETPQSGDDTNENDDVRRGDPGAPTTMYGGPSIDVLV